MNIYIHIYQAYIPHIYTTHKNLSICPKYREVIAVLSKGFVVILLLVMVMYNVTVKDSTVDSEDNTWEVFKHVRDFALKIIQWRSNCYFFETCIREHLRIKGLRVKDNKSFNNPELRSRCTEHYLLAERKVTHENYEFAKKRKKRSVPRILQMESGTV